MTQLTEEQQERLLHQLVETPAGERIRMKCGAADLRSVIIDALSLLDSDCQAAPPTEELTAASVLAEKVGRQAFAAELLGHLDSITSTTAAYHFVRNTCKIELDQKPDSLGAEVD